ncbi:MAG: hypothetical protein DI601_24910, partial [Azospirillum brasilense]
MDCVVPAFSKISEAFGPCLLVADMGGVPRGALFGSPEMPLALLASGDTAPEIMLSLEDVRMSSTDRCPGSRAEGDHDLVLGTPAAQAGRLGAVLADSLPISATVLCPRCPDLP